MPVAEPDHIRPDGDITPFEFPQVELSVAEESQLLQQMPTARQLEALHQRAWQEGFDAGHGEGYRAGESEAADELAQRRVTLDSLLRELSDPLAAMNNELLETIADLALLIARHLVRREIRTAPDEVVGVVREALRHLPASSRLTTLHLNPDDVELVRESLSVDEQTARLRLEADPLITRGGCLVETETSRIDSTVESRIAAVASQMFGGERDGDHA